MKTAAKFILFILLTGCDALTDFRRPEIISVNPAHNSRQISPGSVITVDFSKPMDTVKCNNEFSLNGESGKVEGTFFWENDDTRMVFTPRNDLPPAGRFVLRVTENAEDKKGNDLKNEFLSDFFVSGENTAPYILSFTPAANSTGNSPVTPVVITFSEPVSLNSIYKGISITPSVQGVFSWNRGESDSDEITFTPLYGFSYGVTYTVTMSDSIPDLNGNRLRDNLVFNFTTGDDFVKPELSVSQDRGQTGVLNFSEALVNNGAEKDRMLIILFSEIINTDNLRSAVSITPAVGYFISSEVSNGRTTAYINFTENLLSEEIYTLKINSGITDLQMNPLVHDYRFVFVTDGVNSIAPSVLEIGDLNPPPPPALQFWAKGEIQMLPLQAVPLFYNDIIIDFTSPVAPASLSVYAENAAGAGGSPAVININWPEGNFDRFTRLSFGLYNVAAGNIYRLVIKGGKNGLRDLNGNYMKNDFVQMVKF
jgi:hypothetical protein